MKKNYMEEDCDRGFVVMMASFAAEANRGGAAKDMTLHMNRLINRK
jgi:hypothetical protein